MADRGPQNRRWDKERFQMPALGFGRIRPLVLNKFFDPDTPSMRKVSNGEKKEKCEEKESNVRDCCH